MKQELPTPLRGQVSHNIPHLAAVFADGRIDIVPAVAALQPEPVLLIQTLPAIAAAELCAKIAVTQEDPLLYCGL